MNTVNEIKRIILENKDNIAFVIGNGINRYHSTQTGNSWDDLLIKLWRKVHINQPLNIIPEGISLTEFYDMLDLENAKRRSTINLQKEFCNLIKDWKYGQHHCNIVQKTMQLNAPLLTTNFENILAKTHDLKFQRIEDSQRFTDFYPWSCYYGTQNLNYPTDGFGIWHINGMQRYFRSIRLGLSHYMGAAERARRLIHRGNEAKLFSGKDVTNWKGSKTWLHIIFNKSLFIFGLGLEENEIFLRWLLIERAKYLNKFPDRKLQGWYLDLRDKKRPGKTLFLEGIGFQFIGLASYDEIYELLW